MIRHVAMFKFKDGVSRDDIAAIDAALADLPTVVPEIQALRFGADVGITDGAWDYAVTTDLASAEAYAAYRDNPDHRQVVGDVIKPHVAESARIQFEMPG